MQGGYLSSFCSRFNTLRLVLCLHSFAYPQLRTRLQLKAKTRTPYCLSPTPDVACGKFKVFSLLALRTVARCVMPFNALCFVCTALYLYECRNLYVFIEGGSAVEIFVYKLDNEVGVNLLGVEFLHQITCSLHRSTRSKQVVVE